MTNGKLQQKAERLAELAYARKEIEAEETTLRAELAEKMEPNQYIKMVYNGTTYRLMNEKQESKVLVGNAVIAKAIGRDEFLKIAKVSMSSLTKAVGKEEIGKFISKTNITYCPVLREIKEVSA